jgi:hypothetical protein
VGPRLMVDAAPGAGKSTALAALCRWTEVVSGGRLRTTACAMQGSAAALLPRGATVYTMLSIGAVEARAKLVVEPLTARNKLTAEAALQRVFASKARDFGAGAGYSAAVVAMDEMSQFTLGMLAHMDQRLREAQPTGSAEADLAFGGHAVVFQGDFFQMKPVMAHSIYTDMVDYFVIGEPRDAEARKVWWAYWHPTFAAPKGAALVATMIRRCLRRQMRLQGAGEHIVAQQEMIDRFRDIDSDEFPISEAFLRCLKVLSPEDVKADPGWVTRSKVVVVGNVERHWLTVERALAFAAATGQHLLKWRLRAGGEAADLDVVLGLTPEELDELQTEEPGLWGYAVLGAPAVTLWNRGVARGLANGAPCTVLGVGYYPDAGGGSRREDEARRAVASAEVGAEVEIPEPDYTVVEFPGASMWRDCTRVRERAVVLLPRTAGPPAKARELSGPAARRHNLSHVSVCGPLVELWLVSTNFKEQGQSEDYSILSLVPGGHMPLTIHGLYVMFTRSTRGTEGIRLLGPEGMDPVADLAHLTSLPRDEKLVAFLRGYDAEGRWSAERSRAAYVRERQRRGPQEGKRKTKAPKVFAPLRLATQMMQLVACGGQLRAAAAKNQEERRAEVAWGKRPRPPSETSSPMLDTSRARYLSPKAAVSEAGSRMSEDGPETRPAPRRLAFADDETPPGMLNLKYDCYMNAVLQCMCAHPAWAALRQVEPAGLRGAHGRVAERFCEVLRALDTVSPDCARAAPGAFASAPSAGPSLRRAFA